MTVKVKETNDQEQMADISAITFEDFGKAKDKISNRLVDTKFEITLPIQLFKRLLTAVAQYVIKE